MDPQVELSIVRRAYAKQTLAAARLTDPRLEAAFGAVPREDFLGPGPWLTFHMPGLYTPTPDTDPVLLYVNQVFAIVPERSINNGQPSLHAALLAAAAIQPGEHVVHIGAGTGYYTAIMALLAGDAGRVTAIEYDTALAARARANLAPYANVSVIEGNGAVVPFDAADVIYVNAGVTHPADSWLDGLREGGRLILPLTTDDNTRSFNPGRLSGLFFRIQRHGVKLGARPLLPTAIIPAEGMRDGPAAAALAAAFDKGGWNTVTELVRGESVADERCWLRGDGWWLACSPQIVVV